MNSPPMKRTLSVEASDFYRAAVLKSPLKSKTIDRDIKLVDLVAEALAKEIAQHPEHYVKYLKTVPSEYLKIIFPRLNYVILDKFHRCKLL
jgi:hypothetical protein